MAGCTSSVDDPPAKYKRPCDILPSEIASSLRRRVEPATRSRIKSRRARDLARAPCRGHIRPGGVTLLTPSGELRRHRRQPRRKQFAPPPLSAADLSRALLTRPARNIARLAPARAREIVFVNTPLWRRVATFASTQSSQNVHSTF